MVRSLYSFLQSPTGRILRTVLSIGLVALFVGLIDWSALGELRQRLRWDLAAWALLFAVLAYPLHGLRWHLLLRAQGLEISHGWTQAVSWIGGFYNSLLLGGVGGDAARAVYALRAFPERKAAAMASLAMDRVMGLLVLFALCAGLLVGLLPNHADSVELQSLSLLAVGGAGSLAIVCGLGLLWSVHRWPSAVRRRLGPERLNAIEALRLRTLAEPGRHALALVCSIAIWWVDFVSIWLLAASVGLELPFLECSVAAAAAYVATVLPISIGGHGVREGALLATLAALDLVAASGPTRDPALLLATSVWAVTIACSLIGGVTLLFWSNPAPATPRS